MFFRGDLRPVESIVCVFLALVYFGAVSSDVLLHQIQLCAPQYKYYTYTHHVATAVRRHVNAALIGSSEWMYVIELFTIQTTSDTLT